MVALWWLGGAKTKRRSFFDSTCVGGEYIGGFVDWLVSALVWFGNIVSLIEELLVEVP